MLNDILKGSKQVRCTTAMALSTCPHHDSKWISSDPKKLYMDQIWYVSWYVSCIAISYHNTLCACFIYIYTIYNTLNMCVCLILDSHSNPKLHPWCLRPAQDGGACTTVQWAWRKRLRGSGWTWQHLATHQWGTLSQSTAHQGGHSIIPSLSIPHSY